MTRPDLARVYRLAAKVIEELPANLHTFSCTEILRTGLRADVGYRLACEAHQRYVSLYGPGSMSIGGDQGGGDDYLPATAFFTGVPGVLRELSQRGADNARVLALCFAAAMAETGDL